MTPPLSADLLRKMDAYWRASNYLSVGQIYLLDNPLLREPLKLEHVKPRLVGHWGTTPGLNFVYVHLNRVIQEHDLNVLYVTGPGQTVPPPRQQVFSLWVGVALVVLGVAVNVAAAVKHWHTVRRLEKGQPLRFHPLSLGTIVALLMGFLGIVMAAYLLVGLNSPG